MPLHIEPPQDTLVIKALNKDERQVLLALELGGDVTGYIIVKRIEERTKHMIGIASLYVAISKLGKKELVSWESIQENGKARFRYSLTDRGREIASLLSN